MPLTIITVVSLLLYGLLIFYYHKQWRQLPLYPPVANEPSVFVSVVVAARNEETTLPHLIADLGQQAYPAQLFEVVIVNDHSTDNTAAIADGLSGNMQMVLPDAPPEASSKKAAITTGIAKAKGPLLVITDADCRVGTDWLRTMASFYQERAAAFIAAPVMYTGKASLLHLLQTLDFITLQGITAASVAAGVHDMCNGANLAYTKQAFHAVNGFAGIDRVATGDDMLLMHKIRQQHPKNIFFLKSKAAIVRTQPAQTWKAFFAQRRRWASKTLVYDDWRIIAVLAFVLLFNLLAFVLLAAAVADDVYWPHVLAFVFCKTVVEWPFVSSVAAFFGQQKLMRWFVLLQPLHIVYTVVVGVVSQFGKYEWKGRRTR